MAGWRSSILADAGTAEEPGVDKVSAPGSRINGSVDVTRCVLANGKAALAKLQCSVVIPPDDAKVL
jgi:hypothetical protein